LGADRPSRATSRSASAVVTPLRFSREAAECGGIEYGGLPVDFVFHYNAAPQLISAQAARQDGSGVVQCRCPVSGGEMNSGLVQTW
jgi:hypothetical protein